ncbi:hypothetical protein [Hufsiella ginkgonis]|uniref:Uncharacterized protein n=1 Tax=Hufsiella ginkgonis TaxID=2695274 RepID=A0A7K1XUC1_9SPHI|nr:hypothetical protein [Hufsiella ginkgonis]MXV14397.1 hypothetical protein [Hufsiella ginkgonis]
MKKWIAIVLGSLFAKAGIAQEYYVTMKGDTVRGEIKSFDKNGIRFKPEDGPAAQKVPIGDVKAFYDKKDKSVYFRQYLPDVKDDVFVKLLEDGRIRLYERLDLQMRFGAPTFGFGGISVGGMNQSKQKNWYASKDGKPLEEVKTSELLKSKSRSERKDSFYSLFDDDPDMMEVVKKSGQFGFDDIRKFIKQYNELNPVKSK